jgi:hypothetical protein
VSLSEGANCCRHGLGHWDQLAGDLRLGLGAKLEAAATEKRGKNYEAPEDHRMLPKGARARHILPALKSFIRSICWTKMCKLPLCTTFTQ